MLGRHQIRVTSSTGTVTRSRLPSLATSTNTSRSLGVIPRGQNVACQSYSGQYGEPENEFAIALRIVKKYVFQLAFAVLVSLAALSKPFVSIPAGHTAAVDLFGYVQKRTIPQGVHFKIPFASAHNFSLKTQLIDSSQDVPTSEGLIVKLEVSLLFRVKEEFVGKLYQTVGTNYREVLVLPEVKSTVRALTSRVSAKALYSAGRTDLSDGIVKELNAKLEPRGIIVEEALLRQITLPDLVTRAIEAKLRAEQESQQMEFVIIKEKQEANRKRIEAQGISDFQAIVSEGINAQLLEWKGIEATETLAKSPNAKVVVIGNSQNGLPLILGDGSNTMSARPTSNYKK
ncbi:hypothetical protein CYMTET_52885 [Cymbomonas tetramitiformis]|uniref:Prohibitin n=1 Tax=Cymbomonas tetramitiformis TaxID=36881 RepID=A0AAE0ESA4_9CHLO|nr:hypothetical protein CYMTET_52885 [Cymbomonas tetramitiformis]